MLVRRMTKGSTAYETRGSSTSWPPVEDAGDGERQLLADDRGPPEVALGVVGATAGGDRTGWRDELVPERVRVVDLPDMGAARADQHPERAVEVQDLASVPSLEVLAQDPRVVGGEVAALGAAVRRRPGRGRRSPVSPRTWAAPNRGCPRGGRSTAPRWRSPSRRGRQPGAPAAAGRGSAGRCRRSGRTSAHRRRPGAWPGAWRGATRPPHPRPGRSCARTNRG